MNTSSEQTAPAAPKKSVVWTAVKVVFGVLIVALVVVGSLLIMADLNDNMMLGPDIMNLQMQH